MKGKTTKPTSRKVVTQPVKLAPDAAFASAVSAVLEKHIGRPFRTGAPTVPIALRATEAELLLWRARAEKAGQNLSEWIRARCNGGRS